MTAMFDRLSGVSGLVRFVYGAVSTGIAFSLLGRAFTPWLENKNVVWFVADYLPYVISAILIYGCWEFRMWLNK